MIIALSGPSGIGKGYVKEAIKEICPDIQEIIWYTTRELRRGEELNSNRRHISETEFEKMVSEGKLVLAQGMFGHRYAIERQSLSDGNGVFLTEIHPYVIGKAKQINPNIKTVGLVTDDFDLLRERLADRRKTESAEEIDKRIASAQAEVKAINDNLEYYDETISIKRDNEHLIAKMAQDIFRRLTSREAV